MRSGSNLHLFSIFTITILLIGACDRRDNDVIPDVFIDFTLDLNDPEFQGLNFVTGHLLVNANTNNMGPPAAGYMGSGIIVYHSNPGEFNAYDRTCPHDFVTYQKVEVVNVDGIYAICPSCSTSYALPGYGTPTDGPGRYPLKNYRTSYNGRFIRVWNRY